MHKNKISPWNKIFPKDKVYFKDAGEPITAMAEVEKVLQFENYNEEKLKEIIENYSKDIAFVSPKNEVFEWAKEKNHCILIFLNNPQEIEQFYNINH